MYMLPMNTVAVIQLFDCLLSYCTTRRIIFHFITICKSFIISIIAQAVWKVKKFSGEFCKIVINSKR